MKYHNITHEDMINGEGIRVVLWVAGCNHHCKGCQNPITWNHNYGVKFDKSAMYEIYNELDKPYCNGITFSGGDPFYPKNRKTVLKVIKNIKAKYPHQTIWIYTGYLFEDIKDKKYINKILKYTDVLLDGEYIEELNSPDKHWVGSSNQRVIDVQKSLKQNKIIIYE